MTDNRTTELTAMERFRTALEKRGIEFETNDDECAEGEERTTLFKANLGEGEFDIFVAAKDWYFDGKLTPWLDVEFHNTLTPEQAIAATLGSEREKALEKLVRIYGEISNYFCERFACCDAEFANCKYCIGLPQGGQCELGWCNDESRALGIEQPDYGGGECEPVNLQELYDRIAELEAELGSERIAELEAENERLRKAGYEIGYHDAMKAAKRGGTLTAEQMERIYEIIEKHWHDLPAEYNMPEATALPEYSYDWQAIADELNAALGETNNGCYLMSDGKKFPVELDYGFTGLTPMPFAITVSGFRYSLEVPE